jgi:transmembrane sensor
VLRPVLPRYIGKLKLKMGELSSKEWEDLAEKWLNGSITASERLRFDEWYEQEAGPSMTLESGDADADAFRARLLERIKMSIGERSGSRDGGYGGEQGIGHVIGRRGWWTGAAAVAAAALILVVGGWLWTSRGIRSAGMGVPAGGGVAKDIVPGRSGAILTLSGGRKMLLDSSTRGMVGLEGNSAVFNADGELSYKTLRGKPPAVEYNTLTTDRGNVYQLALPDGTRVWLNAASSITYPTVFSGDERKVRVTGEAYFEVVHRDRMPFKVSVGNQEIEDLGTRFDVNDYADDAALKTTLLEGSVMIGEVVLRPGQQARVDGGGRISVLKDADVEQVMAWKNGLFQFDHADLKSVMAEIGRWYDVDVRYEGAGPGGGGADGGGGVRRFGGKISRFSDAADVLKVLELSQVHFRMEHRTIIVMP